MKQHWKRALSVFLSVVMLFSMTGTNTVLAVERGTPPSTTGLCEHHPSHTEECGYAGGNTGTPCGHEHSDECCKEVTKCVHKHTDDCYDEEADIASVSNANEPVNCSHRCDEESGCMTQALDCFHEHNEDCGYIAGVPGTPCAFVCEECAEKDQVNGGEGGGLSRGDSGSLDITGTVVIAAFEELSDDVLYQSYKSGDIESQDALILPGILNGTDEDEGKITIVGVTWESAPAFDPEAPGEYTFSPVLPEGYMVANSVDMPEILVTIQWNNASSDAGIIVAIEAYNHYHAENGGTGEFSASGAIEGTVTGAAKTLELEIPAGAKVVWNANFSGNLSNAPMVRLTGDGAFEVYDYCIFGRGSAFEDVIEVGGSVTFTGITGEGVVAAWAASGTGPYTEGSTTDLTAWSKDNASTVQWALEGGESGIRYTYANGALTDFLAVDGVTVTAAPPVLTSGTVTRTSDTEATVTFTSNQAGVFYYEINSTVSSAEDLAGSMKNRTNMIAGENTIRLTGLAAGAHILSIAAVENENGVSASTVSNLLTVSIPAYADTGSTQLAENGLLTLSDTGAVTDHYDTEGWKWDGSILTLKQPDGGQKVQAVNFADTVTSGAKVVLESDVALDAAGIASQPSICYEGATGTLTIDPEGHTLTAGPYITTFCCNAGSHLTITGSGTVNAEGGIGAAAGALTISGSVHVTANGKGLNNALFGASVIISGGTVTAISTGTGQAMNIAPSLEGGMAVLTASVNSDGSNPASDYDARQIGTYKYLKIGRASTITYPGVELQGNVHVGNAGYPNALAPTEGANGSTVTVNDTSNTTDPGFVFGGYNNSGASAGNTVTLNNGATVEYSVFGGAASGGGSVTGNTVTLHSGSAVYNLYGGWAEDAGSASGNIVIVHTGAVVEGNVYGGILSSASGITADNNTVTLHSGVAVGNDVYGGNKLSILAIGAGNRLVLIGAGQSVGGNLKGFQTLDFSLPAATAGGSTVLTVAGEADITGVTVALGFEAAPSLNGGSKITLIDAGAGTLTGVPANSTVSASGYTFRIKVEDSKLVATVMDEVATYTATLNIRLDGSPSNSEATPYTLKLDGDEATAYDMTGAGATRTANVPNGTWKVYDSFSGEYTGVMIVIKDGPASAALDWFSCTYTVIPQGSASHGSMSISINGTPQDEYLIVGFLLKGEDVVFTATGSGAVSYTYAWSGTHNEVPISSTGNTYRIPSVQGVVEITCTITGSDGGQPQSYSITVINGTSNPTSAAQGETVAITAGAAPAGQRFRAWNITPAVTFADGTSKTSATAKFTMPDQEVTAEVTYEKIPDGTIPVTGITLNRSTLSLYSNTTPNTAALTATVSPGNAADKTVTWASGNPSVAAVDQNGNITAVGNGSAVITVTTTDGGYTASCTVTVMTYSSGGTGGGSSGGSSGGTSSQPAGTITQDPKKGKVNSLTGIITGSGTGYSNWQPETAADGNVRWKLQYADGTTAAGTIVTREDGSTYEQPAWEMVNGAWYPFGADGYVKSGMIYDPALGGYFYIDINTGMKTGWQLIDGKWYYFNPVSDGKQGILFADAWIDGWYVDKNGLWNGEQKKE